MEKQTISSYYANYGTTEIYRPLHELFELKKSEKLAENWNIFLLTDGCVDNKPYVLQLIQQNCSKEYQSGCIPPRVYAFGVGNGADKDLVERAAKLGHGKSYLVTDANKSQLKSQVIDALQNASEPYLKSCKFTVIPNKSQT